MRLLPVFAVLLGFATSAQAADLARRSALGEIFAERPAAVVVVPVAPPPPPQPVIYVKVPGYYGGYDTPYRNYYGSSPQTIFGRLPYACKLYALC